MPNSTISPTELSRREHGIITSCSLQTIGNHKFTYETFLVIHNRKFRFFIIEEKKTNIAVYDVNISGAHDMFCIFVAPLPFVEYTLQLHLAIVLSKILEIFNDWEEVPDQKLLRKTIRRTAMFILSG